MSGERIDFLKVDTEGFDLEVIKGLGNVRPAIVQIEFWGDEFIFIRTEKNRADFVSSAEIIRELRKREFLETLLCFAWRSKIMFVFAPTCRMHRSELEATSRSFRIIISFLRPLAGATGVTKISSVNIKRMSVEAELTHL